MEKINSKLIFLGAALLFINLCAGQPNNEKPSDLLNSEIVPVFEVDHGKSAILLCYSNDEEHFFLFWQVAKDDEIVGPANKYNRQKYEYEILSGNLTVREASDEEQGIYHCVSRGVRNNNINIRSVRMVVNDNFYSEALQQQSDSGVNYFRGVVITGSVLVIVGAILFVLKLRKRHRLQSLLEEEDDDEEDSGEEIFRAPGTSKQSDDTSSDFKNDIIIKFDDILENTQK